MVWKCRLTQVDLYRVKAINCGCCVVVYEAHTHTHPFNGPLSGTTQVIWCQKGKTNLDFTEARDSEWQWHLPGNMQVCTSLQTDNHASTPPLSFLQAGCPSCRPTNSVIALKARCCIWSTVTNNTLAYPLLFVYKTVRTINSLILHYWPQLIGSHR